MRGMVDLWCGEQMLWDKDKPFDGPRLASCNKCSAAIGKLKLANLPRIEMRKHEKPMSYMRSSYDVLIDGDVRGFIACESGWGTHWNLFQLREPHSHSFYDHGKKISGSRLDHWDAQRWPTEGEHANKYHFWPVHWASKEAMLVAAWHAFERGALPTVEQMAEAEAARLAKQEADRVERAASQARYEAQRIEDRRVKDERLEAWRLAFPDLLARDDLTNLERAGLEAAQALIVGS